MAQNQQQKKSETKKARRRGHYVNGIENMVRRAKQVYRRYARYARLAAKRGEACSRLEDTARTQAQKCASAHGPVVANTINLWLQRKS